MKNYHIKKPFGILILLALLLVSLGIASYASRQGEYEYFTAVKFVIPKKIRNYIYPAPPPPKPPPPPASMARMKKQGCVADGLLNGYGDDTKNTIKMINRSECYYLHRSIETWLEPPDWDVVLENMNKIEKKEIVYGMFIAEAIDTKADYYFQEEARDFEFSDMCRKGSKNYWGEHTCKPSFERKEYRKYVNEITRKAMDLGVQNFLFGQVFYQDDVSDSKIDKVIADMKAYAKERGMEIVIGAQTNDIIDESYLRKFDYIEGGVGLYSDGRVENQPCFSRWWKKPGDWCWALLWNEPYSSKAYNVFLHLDWSGKQGDDMSTFALMNKETREQALKNLHSKFISQGHGFMMPMLAVLPKDNQGCYGERRKFYSANKKYSCGDEEVINDIMKKAWK